MTWTIVETMTMASKDNGDAARIREIQRHMAAQEQRRLLALREWAAEKARRASQPC